MRVWLAVLAALGLAAAVPPAWFPGAEFFVLPGLASLYALSRSSRRPVLLAYLAGLAYMLAFSWSLRHVLWAGFVAVGVVGGVYVALTILWSNALRPLCGSAIAFGCAVAATFWLRAEVPEICYPHGQPIHALYRWPGLLGVVTLGGEPLGNFALGALAAALVDAWTAWRVAIPEWGRARRQLLVVALAVSGLGLAGHWLGAAAAVRAENGTLRVAAVEPGFAALFQHEKSYVERLRERLVTPSEDAVRGKPAPDLVVWPESCYPFRAREDGATLEVDMLSLRFPAATSLLAGADLDRADGRVAALALLLDARGKVLGWHEKRVAVPGGERIPFLHALPESWRRAVLAWIKDTILVAPDLEPGRVRPPLRVPVVRSGDARGEVVVGALLCFDNAFPSVARDLVADGAQALVVLSNEAWYRGGDELDQLEAMTVMRCLETRTPCLRCTVDGHTLWVDATGHVRDRVAAEASEPAAKVLAVELPLGAGHLPPLAWLPRIVLALVLLSSLALVRHAFRTWARLPVARS